ncbi:hypothetical protein ROHU_019352 [Labeo rohita]|uniref:Uncharacterized protein n=1 Tax=Labeo rohita TaxID=84645 RepID=A0A498N687_LABRO|nr:hypothetical protein ROHU_019352 [Labeo rohita]
MKEQLQKNTKDITLHYNTVPTRDKPSYTNTECVSTTNTETPAATQASPTKPPEPDPDVLLLMDSNGKFLDPKKLFPHQKVTAKRCSTTSHAHQIIRDFTGHPSCIIIHTGTNDLHSLRNNTADAVRKMAKFTSKMFPESRIIIFTVLPRHDTPPHIIYNINAELSRGCSALPNVHLAHHHHIGLQHLYDGLHLHKDGVCIFAKSLKDAALGRSPASPRHLLPTPRFHQPIHPSMPRNPPPAPARKDTAWTNNTHRPLHPPTAPYTPVNLQSPTSHPPTGHQTPVRKKKPKTSLHQENPPQPKAQSYAEVAARPPAPPSTSTPVSELSQIREMLHTLCNQLLNR